MLLKKYKILKELFLKKVEYKKKSSLARRTLKNKQSQKLRKEITEVGVSNASNSDSKVFIIL